MKIIGFEMDVVWEDAKRNCENVRDRVGEMERQGVISEGDLVVLPELFSTGFAVGEGVKAETEDGETMSFLRDMAEKHGIAICGSMAMEREGRLFNTFFFVKPKGGAEFYEKKHVFSIGGEGKVYANGESGRRVIEYNGVRFFASVCYDLRFPVWMRNVGLEYDVMINVANWPVQRVEAWTALLKARAIENLSYAVGVNRRGIDGNRLEYNGSGVCYDFKGKAVSEKVDGMEDVFVAEIEMEKLKVFREKFPAWRDADEFELHIKFTH